MMFAVISSHMHHQSFMGREVPSYLRRLAALLNRWLMIQPRGKRKGDGSSKAPSTTETTPDLKTPLRESISSINCSFSHEGELLETFACSEVVTNTRAVAHGSATSASSTHAHSRSMDTGLCKEAAGGAGSGGGSGSGGHHSAGGLKRSKRKSEKWGLYNDELLKRLDLLLSRQEDVIKSKNNEVNREWQEVAEVIDRALFWLYVLITFMTTIVILVFVPLGKSVNM